MFVAQSFARMLVVLAKNSCWRSKHRL